jgi:hypothetical protein
MPGGLRPLLLAVVLPRIHGFCGIFLSFDIVVFHWVFRLHRITSGPEANVIEPILVLIGIGFVAYGLTHEKRKASIPQELVSS